LVPSCYKVAMQVNLTFDTMSHAAGKRFYIARKYKPSCLTLLNAVVTIRTALFNIKELSALFMEFVYLFVVIFRVFCGYFPKPHLSVDLCKGGCVFSVTE
jgi:hypothetical protein